MTNLAHNLTEVAATCADRTAIKLDEIELTYRALDAASACAADLLRSLGVKPGDRVGLMLPNVPYFAIAYYGILRAGGVVVPMNVLLKERETGFYLSDSQATAIFAWHDFAARGQGRRRRRGRRVHPGRAGPVRAAARRVRPGGPLGRAARGRRHRGDPLHLGHDRARRRAPSSRTATCARTREVATELLQLTGDGRRDPRRAAAVPFLRADVRAEREHRRRRLPDADPALRRRARRSRSSSATP